MQAWRAGEFNARLWQDMVKFLPASFEGNLTNPRNALVAHSGMCLCLFVSALLPLFSLMLTNVRLVP